MATAQEIADLRLLIAEPTEVIYSDIVLGTRLDGASNQFIVANEIWTEKAAGAAMLVDMSEGGSTRKMGDLFEQYLSMAENMRLRAVAPTQPPDGNGTGIRIRRLTRP